NWDLQIYLNPWAVVRVCTAQEDHGSGKRLVRVRFRLRPSGYLKVFGVLAVIAAVGATLLTSEILALESAALLCACVLVWWRSTCRASRVVAVFDAVARGLGLIRCESSNKAELCAVPAPVPRDIGAAKVRLDEDQPGTPYVPVNGIGINGSRSGHSRE